MRFELKKSALLFCLGVFGCSVGSIAENVLVEAESFRDKGGWVVDQQFMDLMGSPYLMAHGMGVPVADAVTDINIPSDGVYHVYARTYNWTSPWYEGKGPGNFEVSIDGRKVGSKIGDTGNSWLWQYVGNVRLSSGTKKLSLHDLTGFNGRCDAIYLSTDKVPPTDNISELDKFRKKCTGQPLVTQNVKSYDLVVCGAGIAGMCAAMSAARLGMKVALINDRPLIGGCNSSEIRVHLGGRIEVGPYKELGNLIKEFGHTRKGNAMPADYYEDSRKMEWILSEKNISLFTNTRIISVEKSGNLISSVLGKHIESGEEIKFKSPLFVDCTGDGTVGALSGADFRMGRESRQMHRELLAPINADSLTMGASVQWYSVETTDKSKFPVFEYGLKFDEDSKQDVTMGEWTWETGMNFNQISDFEYIRDYGLMVIYSNWSYLKNKSRNKEKYSRRELEWVAYVAGKRESRRLLGDYILTSNDIIDYRLQDDASLSTTWSIDLHYPDPDNTKYFPGMEFKSIAEHVHIYEYPIPYRCLYSRNVDNLFMAGRNISVTHAALGTVRVMRTTGMMGEVVGMAASICKKHNVLPRRVYQKYLLELKSLMKKGTGKQGLPNNQQFNVGGHLKERP